VGLAGGALCPCRSAPPSFRPQHAVTTSAIRFLLSLLIGRPCMSAIRWTTIRVMPTLQKLCRTGQTAVLLAVAPQLLTVEFAVAEIPHRRTRQSEKPRCASQLEQRARERKATSCPPSSKGQTNPAPSALGRKPVRGTSPSLQSPPSPTSGPPPPLEVSECPRPSVLLR